MLSSSSVNFSSPCFEKVLGWVRWASMSRSVEWPETPRRTQVRGLSVCRPAGNRLPASV